MITLEMERLYPTKGTLKVQHFMKHVLNFIILFSTF